MKQHLKVFAGIFIATGFLCFLLLHEQIQEHRLNGRFQLQNSEYVQKNYLFMTRINPSNISLREILRRNDLIIRKEMEDYEFPQGTNLENYTLAAGGQPLRNIIVATWRSGSTFLGDIINSVPGNFYHYEPLLNFGITQIRGPPHSKSALRNLFDLLNCDYSDLGTYLDYGMMHTYLFTHNRRLWRQCDIYPYFCWMDIFLTELCRQFPFQSMKTVRMRLSLLEDLLKSEIVTAQSSVVGRLLKLWYEKAAHSSHVTSSELPEPFYHTHYKWPWYQSMKDKFFNPDLYNVYRYLNQL